jgi:hypothetical protein
MPALAVNNSIKAAITPAAMPTIKVKKIVLSLYFPSYPFKPTYIITRAGIIPKSRLACGNASILNPGDMGNNILKVIDYVS